MTDSLDHPAPDRRHILRDIWSMGYPSMIGFAATNLYTLADMYWVSRLSPEHVAAMAIFNTFYWVVSSVNMIAGGGSVAVIGRRFGENDREKTETAIVEAFVLKFALAATFCLVGFYFTPAIVTLLGGRGDVATLAVTYGQIMFLALVVNFPCWTLYTALRGIKQPRVAMTIMLLSTSLNAVLDPFFIFGWWGLPAYGIAGAAYASMLSFALTVTAGLILFFAGAFKYQLTLASVRRMRISTMWQMLRIGLPTGIGSMSFSVARMVVMPMIAHFGAPVVAIYGVGNRVVELGEIIVVGLELGMAPLIGHALGARDKARAWLTAKLAVYLGAIIMSIVGVVCAFFASEITSVFFAGEPYLSLGRDFFHIAVFFFPFLGLFIVLEGAFNGAGDTVPPMVIGMIHSWVFQIPIVYALAYLFDLGPIGVWWGFVIAAILSCVIFLWWFEKKRWLDRAV